MKPDATSGDDRRVGGRPWGGAGLQDPVDMTVENGSEHFHLSLSQNKNFMAELSPLE
ncbi:hypothetical protein IPZ58_10525 [Streptomyces roseoverticillatus]|uniref:hypothetical protein n=1 Tax=Streptomyces roseoverticillatus TaxID=66429 RepID=UPI001F38D216|nr:hypothetical protein [Streptomyces roseoverticillatus]MCF3102019.1 hypothetical protein [Streptomyces roseoverticillatus]